MNSEESINEAIGAVHNLLAKVEQLYDASLMSTTQHCLSVVYVLLVGKRELEKEQACRHLRVVR